MARLQHCPSARKLPSTPIHSRFALTIPPVEVDAASLSACRSKGRWISIDEPAQNDIAYVFGDLPCDARIDFIRPSWDCFSGRVGTPLFILVVLGSV